MPEPDPHDYDQAARTLHLIIGRIARDLRRSHQTGDLTLSEASLLARLEMDGPKTPGELAEAENVRPQAIAATVAALERMGYVDRASDPEDRRRVIVSLSRSGAALRQERRGESAARLARAMSTTLRPDEVQQLNDAIALLTRLADAL